MTTLSPAAASIVLAFDDRYEICSMFNENWQEECLAAVLRAAAYQVAPSDAMEPRNYLPMALECQRIRAELLAIAAELESQ